MKPKTHPPAGDTRKDQEVLRTKLVNAKAKLCERIAAEATDILPPEEPSTSVSAITIGLPESNPRKF